MIKLIVFLIAVVCHHIGCGQAKTSGMADGGVYHISERQIDVSAISSVVSSPSSSSEGSSTYSTSGTAPAMAKPEEAFAYQLQHAKEIAITINARRMQKINSKMRSIQFNNPFIGAEPTTNFTDWDKEKSKFDNNGDNQDYSTLSTTFNSTYRYASSYVNHNSLIATMTSSDKVDFTENEIEKQGREDIQKEYLTKVADETIDKTIDEIEDKDVKSRLKSIKEIHYESYDLLETMVEEFFKPYPQEIQNKIDNYFKPYPPDVAERIDKFFGTYKGRVMESFTKANSHIREKAEQIENNNHIEEMIFNKYNSLRP